MGKLIDITGQRFGRLTVLGRAGIYRAPDQETICLTWRCRCDCGNETVVIGNNLKLDDAVEAVWRILNGMGYSLRHNERLAEEVDAVLGDYPVESFEPVIKCRDCKHWKTPLAFTATGRCAHPDHKGQITNRNYFCADGGEKE